MLDRWRLMKSVSSYVARISAGSHIQARHRVSGNVRRDKCIVGGFEMLEDRLLLSTLVSGGNVNLSQLRGNQDESAIIMNPTNTNELFAFSNNGAGGLFAARSTDGGATWLSSNGLDALIADGGDSLVSACCDPTAAWDEFGNLFIGYLDAAVSTNPIALSTDGGLTFSRLQNLGKSPDQPTIVTGPGPGGVGSSVWVTWKEGPRVVASGAAVNGLGAVGAFSTPASVPGMTGFSFGDIVIGPNGQVVVTAQNNGGDEGPDNIRISTDPDGLGPAPFGAFVTATTTNVGDFDAIPAQPSRTVDAESGLAYDRSGGAFNGRLYLVYTEEVIDESDDFDVMVRTSDDDGATWSAAVRVNDDATVRSQFMPKIALDQSTGTVAVVWYDARNSFFTNSRVELYGSVSDDGGRTWSANTRISDGVTSGSAAATGGQQLGDYIGLTFHDGLLHPSWADNSNSTGDNPDGTLAELDIYSATLTVVPDVNIIVTETGGRTVVDESGTTDTFSVVLDAKPASNIKLTVVSGDTGEATVNKATLIFTPANWDKFKTVTVTGVDDLIRDGDQTTSITVAFEIAPQTNETVSVITTDNEIVSGTNGGDVFRFTVVRGGYRVQVNRVSYFLDDTVKREVAFQGLGGKDLVVITGGDGRETATLRVGSVNVNGSGYQGGGFTVTGNSIETIRVVGRSGMDRAKLYDSPGNDKLIGRPAFSHLTGKGFDNRVTGFEKVDAYATAGDAGGAGDRASLYDSSGNDRFYARPTFSYLTGKGFNNRATGFDKVDGYAEAGHAGRIGDRAYLYGSAGNDLFYGRKTYSYMTGTNFINVAFAFDKVYASATAGAAGGRDQAYLYDSAGSDNFFGRPNRSILSGPGFFNQTSGFDKVYAYATAGGYRDRAYLYDSSGNDTFYGRPAYSYLSGPGFYNQATGFDSVHARAKAGGPRDRAYLYDSAGNDKFYGKQTSSYLTGAGFHNQASGFDKVYAYASRDAGGVGDRAFVYDSSGKNTFYGRKDYGRLSGRGFLNFAQGFDHVTAYARQGGIDTINIRALNYLFFQRGKWERRV